MALDGGAGHQVPLHCFTLNIAEDEFLKPLYKSLRWMTFAGPFGRFVLFGGMLFLADGGWRSYRQYVQATAWPAADARVAGCSVSGSAHYSSSRHAWGESSYVRCRLAYDAGGAAHESTIQVGGSIFTPSVFYVYASPGLTVAKMRDWVGRHPAGSLLRIHYDPANAANISLAGADGDLQAAPPRERILFGVLVCGGGLLLMALGAAARARPVEPSH